MHITHCPHCQTAFKVRDEHMRAANGWVRCGKCQTVFEAHLYFANHPKTQQAVFLEDETVSLEGVRPGLFAAGSAHKTRPSDLRESWMWPALSVLLVLVLVWQALISARHVLVAEEPALRSLLVALCVPVQCQIDWPQEPHSVLIENSNFSEIAAGGFQLQMRFKNNQRHAVATPWLEVTLTDLQDEVVLRRVLTLEDLALPDHIAALRDQRVQFGFDVDVALRDRVAGYRALIFYP